MASAPVDARTVEDVSREREELIVKLGREGKSMKAIVRELHEQGFSAYYHHVRDTLDAHSVPRKRKAPTRKGVHRETPALGPASHECVVGRLPLRLPLRRYRLLDEALAQCRCDGCIAELLRRYEGMIYSHASQVWAPGWSYEDFVQEGRLAIRLAIFSYEAPEDGVSRKGRGKFSTLAWNAIRMAIREAVVLARTHNHNVLNDAVPLTGMVNGEEGRPDFYAVDPRSDPERIVIARDMLFEMAETVRELSAQQRQALRAYANDQALSSTQWSALRRAQRHVANRLDDATLMEPPKMLKLPTYGSRAHLLEPGDRACDWCLGPMGQRTKRVASRFCSNTCRTAVGHAALGLGREQGRPCLSREETLTHYREYSRAA